MDNTVAILSLWREDAARGLGERVRHLLAKTAPEDLSLRWVWVVGDSEDETENWLRVLAQDYPHKDIEIVRHDTGLRGDEPAIRLKRLSQTVNAGLARGRAGDVYWLYHESDLLSPPDVIGQFLATGHCPVAGWVVLGELFYDTWGYRKNGQMFSNYAPYHPVYRADAPFEVDSVGSCWLLPAAAVQAGLHCVDKGVLDLCEQLRQMDYAIWVEPRIRIEQPLALWVARQHA